MLGRPAGERAWLIAHDDEDLHRAPRGFQALCAPARRGEPLAYLTGRKEFFGLPLQVDPPCWCRGRTPRPWWSGRWSCWRACARRASIDLGTGSGAIALALQSAARTPSVEAVDGSADALAVARANAAAPALPVRFATAWLEGAGPTT